MCTLYVRACICVHMGLCVSLEYGFLIEMSYKEYVKLYEL